DAGRHRFRNGDSHWEAATIKWLGRVNSALSRYNVVTGRIEARAHHARNDYEIFVPLGSRCDGPEYLLFVVDIDILVHHDDVLQSIVGAETSRDDGLRFAIV